MDRYVYDLEQNPQFLTDNQHGSNAKSKVLICNINTPLSTSVLYSMHKVLCIGNLLPYTTPSDFCLLDNLNYIYIILNTRTTRYFMCDPAPAVVWSTETRW